MGLIGFFTFSGCLGLIFCVILFFSPGRGRRSSRARAIKYSSRSSVEMAVPCSPMQFDLELDDKLNEDDFVDDEEIVLHADRPKIQPAEAADEEAANQLA